MTSVTRSVAVTLLVVWSVSAEAEQRTNVGQIVNYSMSNRNPELGICVRMAPDVNESLYHWACLKPGRPLFDEMSATLRDAAMTKMTCRVWWDTEDKDHEGRVLINIVQCGTNADVY